MNSILKTMMLFGLVGLTPITVNGNGLTATKYIDTTIIGIPIRKQKTINVWHLSTTNGEVDLVVLSTDTFVKHRDRIKIVN